MVLHRVKRGAAKVRYASAPDNGEYLSYKRQLEGVCRTLEAAIAALAQSQKMWRAMSVEEKTAAKKYVTMYPDEDYIRDMAEQAASAVRDMDKEFASVQSAESTVRMLDKNARAYVTEIKALSVDYKMVADAKLEYEMYRQKFDALESARRKEDDRIDRNKVKLEESKLNYEGTVRATIERQKELFPKRHTMYKTALCAYWLAQLMYVRAMEENTRELVEYAEENESILFALDVAKLQRKPKPSPEEPDDGTPTESATEAAGA
eukprot:Plantae.Rhodophyta-Rhodochaete_pulchella.ctg8158.p2 GENE.Plantae.Rhodophyta-Rhodochaete_pulchella.ctg8158~~Plantae.Rhodophyta-Rhodochaete_pulchella.ctg8158.p2  ORF type:complete len:263 (-),score=61.15 Plantae.Rhodophyta-Rhodochaete_pulchella.ctg8158:1942-2730(-)